MKNTLEDQKQILETGLINNDIPLIYSILENLTTIVGFTGKDLIEEHKEISKFFNTFYKKYVTKKIMWDSLVLNTPWKLIQNLNAQETDKEQPVKYYFYRIEYTTDALKRETLCGTISTGYNNPIEAFESFKRVHSDKLQLSILSFNLIG